MRYINSLFTLHYITSLLLITLILPQWLGGTVLSSRNSDSRVAGSSPTRTINNNNNTQTISNAL